MNDITKAIIRVDVDESGGTTADYALRVIDADGDLPANSDVRSSLSFLVPAGGAYRIVNQSDPNNNNALNDHREFTL